MRDNAITTESPETYTPVVPFLEDNTVNIVIGWEILNGVVLEGHTISDTVDAMQDWVDILRGEGTATKVVKIGQITMISTPWNDPDTYDPIFVSWETADRFSADISLRTLTDVDFIVDWQASSTFIKSRMYELGSVEAYLEYRNGGSIHPGYPAMALYADLLTPYIAAQCGLSLPNAFAERLSKVGYYCTLGADGATLPDSPSGRFDCWGALGYIALPGGSTPFLLQLTDSVQLALSSARIDTFGTHPFHSIAHDWSACIWFKPSSLANSSLGYQVIGIFRTDPDGAEWQVVYGATDFGGSGKLLMVNFPGGIYSSFDIATSLVTILVDAWHLVYVQYNHAAGKIGISVNNETLVETTVTGLFLSGIVEFAIGGSISNTQLGEYRQLAYQRTLLTIDERSAWYNGGIPTNDLFLE